MGLKLSELREKCLYVAKHRTKKTETIYRIDAIVAIPSKVLGKKRRQYAANGSKLERFTTVKGKLIIKCTCLVDGTQTAFHTAIPFIRVSSQRELQQVREMAKAMREIGQ